MKYLLLTLVAFLPALAAAETLKISTQVLDRADNGSAIRGQLIYPSVELASGETGSMHIGREVRYPVWVAKEDMGNGVSRDKISYEETPVGLLFSIRFELHQGVVTYSGKAVSKVTNGTFGRTTTIDSTEVIFYGQTAIGELVQVEFAGADGTAEEILIFFGPTEE